MTAAVQSAEKSPPSSPTTTEAALTLAQPEAVEEQGSRSLKSDKRRRRRKGKGKRRRQRKRGQAQSLGTPSDNETEADNEVGLDFPSRNNRDQRRRRKQNRRRRKKERRQRKRDREIQLQNSLETSADVENDTQEGPVDPSSPPEPSAGVDIEKDSRSPETEPRDPAWYISDEFASLSNETDSDESDKSEAESEEIDADNEVEGDDDEGGEGKVVRIKHFFGEGDGTLSGVKNVMEFCNTIDAAQGVNGWDAEVTAR